MSTSTNTISKKEKLLNTLRAGRRVTADQAVNRFKFASRNSFYATVSTLRDQGFEIVAVENRNGVNTYQL